MLRLGINENDSRQGLLFARCDARCAQNSDRHHGHFLWGEHWAAGKVRVGMGPGLGYEVV